MGILV